MKELTPEELEDVTGGGIKEIVAATTLAAMAMTGNTVSAFGLANALAEDAGHIEFAPEQEDDAEDAFGGEMSGEITLDVVDGGDAGDAEASVAEVQALELGSLEEDSAVLLDDDGDSETLADNAAEGEEEFDLSAVNGDGALEDDSIGSEQTIKDLIDMTVEETKGLGIYGTLNSTFATLADNAWAMENPETGAIEADGSQIVNLTYDALASHFDATPEQLMGAIGAATYRADKAGYIQALGNDPTLVSMAANEAAKSSPISESDIAKASLDLTLDGLSAICPAFGPFSGFFKSLAGPLMGGGTNIEAEFKALQNQISAAEKSLKQNTYNVVQLGSIDNRFVDLNARATSLQSKIADITESHKLSDAQKLQKLADLIDSGELRELTNAVNAATECFTSTQVDELANRNLFEAAYQRACGEVMFSGEALDMTVPYLTRQLASYTQACATMAQVYNAYEQVYGAGSLNGSRGLMIRNITGCDLNGKHVQDSVFDLFKDYASRSRFVFVNKDSKGTGIEVSQELGMITLEKGEREDKKLGKTGLSVLSTDQVKDITEYSVKTRGVCLHDYLANNVGFKMDENSVKKTTRTVKGLFPGSGETIKKEVWLTGSADNTGYLYWFGYDFWNKSTDKQMYTTGIGGKGLTGGAMTDMAILYFKKA